eukprot:11311-Heterococcus_DN1.PRE.2
MKHSQHQKHVCYLLASAWLAKFRQQWLFLPSAWPVGLAVDGAAVHQGLAVVGAAVVGLAVVGAAVVGLAVVGDAVGFPARGSKRTHRHGRALFS